MTSFVKFSRFLRDILLSSKVMPIKLIKKEKVAIYGAGKLEQC